MEEAVFGQRCLSLPAHHFTRRPNSGQKTGITKKKYIKNKLN